MIEHPLGVGKGNVITIHYNMVYYMLHCVSLSRATAHAPVLYEASVMYEYLFSVFTYVYSPCLVGSR